jgi:hypothetical protein
MRLKSLVFFLFILFGAFLVNANAVSYGYSLIEPIQPPSSGVRIYAETGTVLDYSVWQYYDPGIKGQMFENNYLVDSTDIIIDRYNPSVSVYINLNANYGSTYRIHGDHYLGAYNYYLVGGQPQYIDQYGFNNYSGIYSPPYSFLPGPRAVYTYRIYRVATTQVSYSVSQPLRLSSIDMTGGVPGATFLTTLRGTGLFGNGNGQNVTQTVQVSGSGVTATVQPTAPNTIEVLDVNIQIAQDAPVGDRTLTLTVNGQTSNTINFRVGDRTPQITGITPPQGNTGNQVAVTITGNGFGLNPLIRIDGTGINPTITSATGNTINAIFSVADATYLGTRGVRVVSRGVTGGGFLPAPGSSDTSNGVDFTVFAATVMIANVPLVEKNGEQTVNVTVSGLANPTDEVKFTLNPLPGATGAANFDNNTNEIRKGNGSHTLTIKGITESSAINKMTIEATPVNANNVLNHKEFTVAVINSLTFERINSGDIALDENPGPDGIPNPDGSEGQRIFPDKNTPTDGTDRSIIRVRATVLPSDPSINVYFASFDLDDPSANTAPIDPNGFNGNDNNCYLVNGTNNCVAVGNSRSGQLLNPVGGNCTGASINSDISKIACAVSGNSATANYKVTMQPGDNFAIAASLIDAYRTQINIDTSAGGNLINNASQVIPISGAANSNNVQGIRTRMLTVWRKLHIEVDSMGQARENYLRGEISGSTTINRGRSKTLNVTANPLEINRFENGRLVLAAITNVLDVISNTANTVTIKNSTAGNIVLANNVNFELLSQIGGRSAVGTIPVGQTINPMQTVTLNISGALLDVNAFSTGTMSITPILRSLTVTTNTSNSVDVTNNGTTSIVIADSTHFRLYDDDDMDNEDVGNLNGDEGDDVRSLNTSDFSFLTDMSDNPATNYFVPAYIRPMYDLTGSNDNIPFVANVNRFNISDTIASNFNNIGTEARTDFWTIHLITGYQYESGEIVNGVQTTNFDADPYNLVGSLPESAAYGASDVLNSATHTPIPGGVGSLVFMEMSRANEYPKNYSTRPVSVAYTVVHEVGHLFSCAHGEGGLMEPTQTRTTGTFSDTSLSWIRKAINP